MGKKDSYRVMIQPVPREAIVLPMTDGRRCDEATVFDARSVTRKYNATEENICVRLRSGQCSRTVAFRDPGAYSRISGR